MIGKAIAAYIGGKVDRRDGQGGAVGALVGVATYALSRRMLPVAVAAGGAALAIGYLKRKRSSAP